MKLANVSETKDLNYQNGYVECKCGWRKELGNGFNGYHIDNCPKCTLTLYTMNRRKVTTGSPKGKNLTVKLGSFTYFVLSNGIHVQYSASVSSVHTGLSEKMADRL